MAGWFPVQLPLCGGSSEVGIIGRNFAGAPGIAGIEVVVNITWE